LLAVAGIVRNRRSAAAEPAGGGGGGAEQRASTRISAIGPAACIGRADAGEWTRPGGTLPLETLPLPLETLPLPAVSLYHPHASLISLPARIS
jgi:hypothetical protein